MNATALIVVAGLFGAILTAGPAASQADGLAARLIGTWKVTSAIREEAPSGAKTDQMGPNPAGYVTYGPDGRMMAIVIRGDRVKPSGRPTAAEAETLFRSMVSYAGVYAVEGDRVTHTVDVSWNESWTGTKQVRIITFDGADRVTLSTETSRDPIDGKMSVRRISYDRVK